MIGSCPLTFCVSRGELVDGGEEEVFYEVFWDEGGGARGCGLGAHLGLVVEADEDDFGVGAKVVEGGGGFKTVHVGHFDVHYDDVGVELAGESYGR